MVESDQPDREGVLSWYCQSSGNLNDFFVLFIACTEVVD